MRGDDDEEEESSVNATRYPCMPSLVALQQMRNRLHLAHLGKKLMKWTAMATGRELRRLAGEIDETYKNFAEDMRSAFMLLARGRYFYPNMNNTVLENVALAACVTVATSSKSISGVKVLQLEVIETGFKPYPHLGIEKGGQTIQGAKKAWLDLLKRLIIMLQQRTSFYQLEQAHKSATKRMNVLKKITIPRIKSTISYIIVEMEEFSREELFRIKIIQHKKAQVKKKVDHEEPGHICPLCSKRIGGKIEEAPEIFVPKLKPSVKKLDGVKDYKKEIAPTERISHSVQKQGVESARHVDSRRALDPLHILTTDESQDVSQLQYLMDQLGKIIALGSGFVGNKIQNVDVNDLLIACEEAKAKLETLFQSEATTDLPKGDILYSKIEHLKAHLKEVTGVMNEFRNEAILSPSVDNFVRTCENVDEKLNIYMKKDVPKPVTDATKNRLKELKTQIDDVVKVTKQYQKEELLSPSAEAFLQSCEVIKSKIDSRIQESADLEKLSHLKEHVEDLESLTTKVKSEGLLSPSLEDFLKSCRDFKMKLSQRKEKDETPPTEGGLERLVSQIDETIELSRAARASGLVSASVEDFIKSCEDIKSRIESKQGIKSGTAKPNVLDELEVNISDIMQLISKFKKEGLITESMEDFIKSCEMTKSKMDLYKRYPGEDINGKMLYPTCSGSCMCSMDESLQDICEKCEQMNEENKQLTELPPTLCDTCKGEPPENKTDSDLECESCSKPAQEEEPSPAYMTPEDSSEMCDVCRRYIAESETEKEQEKEKEEKPASPVDSTLGYFEKKVRKITRVTRTRNDDGTVREEKETITVRKEKHDPNETTIDDDDDDFGDVSFESLIEEDEKKVALCLTPNLIQRGFMNLRSQSENLTKRYPMAECSLRPCFSATAVEGRSLHDTTHESSVCNSLLQSQNNSTSTSNCNNS
ncbi:uncharacterized protein LOC115440292 isoform X2 [Manduca sexta]|uniref:uncharacterized protein LOC115440292 isoform X2 n=1 Tax=Manduca sexta TaxID=7130 RepID=UPI00188FBB6B|nr:uncharacterized protein LOC115440292 isoform X2 [Manduca sexta]